MARAIALTMVQQQNPLVAAYLSACNAVSAVVDFMYGTPARVKVTTVFLIAMIFAAQVVNGLNSSLLQTCPV